MSRLTRDGTAEPVSRDQILRRERGQGKFPCSADHKQKWQPYPVDPYSCYMCDHTYYIVEGVVGRKRRAGVENSLFMEENRIIAKMESENGTFAAPEVALRRRGDLMLLSFSS